MVKTWNRYQVWKKNQFEKFTMWAPAPAAAAAAAAAALLAPYNWLKASLSKAEMKKKQWFLGMSL